MPSFTLSITPRRWPGNAARPSRVLRFAVAAITTAASCAHSGAGSAPAPPQARADSTAAVRVGPIPVAVENRSTRDVVIYAVRGTLRRRLGSVPGLSRAALTVPDTFTSDFGGFSLAATAIASGESYTSDPVAPQPGLRLVLTLEVRLASSALAVVE